MATEPVFSHAIRLGKRSPSTFAILAKAANFTIEQNDVFIIDSTAGNVTVTLPKARAARGRQLIVYKRVAANTVTVQRTAADVIGYAGGTSVNLAAQDAKLQLISDGETCWLRIQ